MIMTGTAIIDEYLTQACLLFGLSDDQLKNETRFKEDLNATSLQYMGMISIISELTGKELSYAAMRKYKTVGDVIGFLETL